ncbi:DUF3368 domain-containing protein [Halorientalis salina]|uniref:DUF3368 domain-containing protein n=1 Tax=Halorientalis salina TaxID=2932266 RepID=UPI0010AD8D83|nr:DUF3368 domain-containing protein [Halorientalis salina]
MSRADRTVLVDADVFITFARVGAVDVLRSVQGTLWMPVPVDQEIVSRPAATELASAIDAGWLGIAAPPPDQYVQHAALHLGRDVERVTYNGDIFLLAQALAVPGTTVVTDDKPLRRCCRRLSIPVAGSVAVLVRAVERGTLGPARATATLFAMDKVGPRLSASVLRDAERLIAEAAETPPVDEAPSDDALGDS